MEKPDITVMLYDTAYWTDLINFRKLVEMGMISEEDLDLFRFFDSADDGLAYLKPRLKEIIARIDHFIP